MSGLGGLITTLLVLEGERCLLLLGQAHRTDVVALAEQLWVEDAVAVALEVVDIAAVHARAQTVGRS